MEDLQVLKVHKVVQDPVGIQVLKDLKVVPQDHKVIKDPKVVKVLKVL